MLVSISNVKVVAIREYRSIVVCIILCCLLCFVCVAMTMVIAFLNCECEFIFILSTSVFCHIHQSIHPHAHASIDTIVTDNWIDIYHGYWKIKRRIQSLPLGRVLISAAFWQIAGHVLFVPLAFSIENPPPTSTRRGHINNFSFTFESEANFIVTCYH